MSNGSQWYEVTDDSGLQQGDIIVGCPVIIPPQKLSEAAEGVEVEVKEYDVIIMSQSCDLQHGKLDLVLVSPILDMTYFESKEAFYKEEQAKEALRRGFMPAYHLLKECTIAEYEREYSIVDFRNVYGVPFDYIVYLAKEQGVRLRLLSPYKEHLSQAFARFFMRVGLPSDIPPFYKGNLFQISKNR